MLSFYGNGAAAGEGGGSTVEQLWERGSGESSIQQILTGTTKSNNASGKEAVAEGHLTEASGLYSHAQGYQTVAATSVSHAEGMLTTASGNYSHAEGNGSKAIGTASHAQGFNSFASGPYSHAEGMSFASENYAHAEGLNTTASGTVSHAEGYQTKAADFSSHAEGYQTLASTLSAHAEGYMTTASGLYSHTEGYYTLTSTASAHAEGNATTASGVYAHAQNGYTLASGNYSHAQNNHTIAASTAQTALGAYNIEDNQNQYAVILGNGTGTNARSNALTVDWNGNVNIAGNLTYNGGQTLSSSLPIVRMEEDPINLGTYSFYDSNDNVLTWANLSIDDAIIQAYDFDGDARRVCVTDYACVNENGTYNLYYILLRNFIPGYIIFNRVTLTFDSATATTATYSSDMIQVAFGAYV